MRRREAPTSPDNYSAELVPVFTPDQRGAALFSGLVNGTVGRLGSRVAMDTTGSGKWHGWAPDPQGPMTGVANIGSARPVVNPVTRLDQAHGVTGDSIQQLFTERMSARRFG